MSVADCAAEEAPRVKGFPKVPEDIKSHIYGFIQTAKEKFLTVLKDPEYREFTDQVIAISGDVSMTVFKTAKILWPLLTRGFAQLFSSPAVRKMDFSVNADGSIPPKTSAALTALGLKRLLAES